MGPTYRLSSRLHLDAPLDRVFSFFSQAENLELLTPTFLRFEIVSETPVAMREGAVIDYRLKVRGVPLRWRSEIPVWDPPHRFVDRQVRGPYSLWVHDHRFEESSRGTVCSDQVDFRVPFGALAYRLVVRRDLKRIFEHRREVLARRFGRVEGDPDGSSLTLGRLSDTG